MLPANGAVAKQRLSKHPLLQTRGDNFPRTCYVYHS